MKKILTINRHIGIYLLILILVCVIPSKSYAQLPEYISDDLHGLSDVISSNTFSSPSVEHKISFSLPFDSFPIRKTDYIQIYFEHFSDVTAPTYVFGDYAGTPSFSVSGKYVRITGIRVQPNAYISIEGILKYNLCN